MLYFYDEQWRAVPKISTFYGIEGAFPIFTPKIGGLFYIF